MPRRKKKTRKKRKTGMENIIKGECPFISPSLECLSDGFGNLNCLDPEFHKNCEVKVRLLRNRGKRVFSG